MQALSLSARAYPRPLSWHTLAKAVGEPEQPCIHNDDGLRCSDLPVVIGGSREVWGVLGEHTDLMI
jgi:hypothetical protein